VLVGIVGVAPGILFARVLKKARATTREPRTVLLFMTGFATVATVLGIYVAGVAAEEAGGYLRQSWQLALCTCAAGLGGPLAGRLHLAGRRPRVTAPR
jgi:hypothetical protein